ncbi:MAG TPA: MFS transporter [Gemmatales bacterium]|nr:MFS transporter [Gemmatales bacterium]
MDQRGPSITGWNEKILFFASFLTLIAAGIGFSVRGAVLKDWGDQFGFTQSELGTITGGGLIGFGITIIVLSFFADAFGYGKLMTLAFLLHASSAVVTFAATPVYNSMGKEGAFWCLNIGMWLFALGNGACEAVINPLTATLFPKNKTHYLNVLHAGWPLGLILGALIVLGFGEYARMTNETIRWEFKLGAFLVPVILYGLMMLGRRFPVSEAFSSGISLSTMIFTILSPILIFLFIMHMMVGYVELGTDSWIVNITNRVLGNENWALYAFIWTNALMFILRFFAGPIVHKISPLGLLCVSAILGATGLYMLGMPFTNTMWMWMAAVTVYGLGKTFYWPTLLGVISERFPKSGAIGLGISGGLGMIAAGMLGSPGIGYKQDLFAVQRIQELSNPTYERYMARNSDGQPDKQGFPFLSTYLPKELPPVAGLDNSKLKVFDDYKKLEDKAKGKTTLESDLDTLNAVKAKGGKVEENLEKSLNSLKKWWDEQGKPNFAADDAKLEEARVYGAKTALMYTALVPAALAIGFLLLILLYAGMGGYRQEHLTKQADPPPQI